MSADFNAGSIEGSLELETSAFYAGLKKAKEQAHQFERDGVDARLGMDSKEFEAKRLAATAQLDELDHKKVEAKADLDITEALAKAEYLKHVMMRGLDVGGLGAATTRTAFPVAKVAAMAGGMMALAAAAAPATAAVVGFGAAAGVAFAGAGVALGLFAASTAGAVKQIKDAIKAGKQLPGVAGQAETAFKGMTGAWKDLQKAVAPQVFGFLSHTFKDIAGVLPKLAPLIKTVATGMTSVVDKVFAVTKTPLFSKFLTQLQQFMGGFLNGLGPVLANLLKTFMHLFSALQPIMSMLGHSIREASADLRRWAASLDASGIQPFVDYMQQMLPKLGRLIGDVFSGLVNIGSGLRPLVGPALDFIDSLVRAIGKIDLSSISQGFGDMLSALRPLLPVAASLINAVLEPLGRLFTSLANGPVAAFAHELGTELQPALKAFRGILDALVQPLSDFLGSIANLVNPTGIKLVATLLQSLEQAVKTVAPSFGRLAVALESVIDDGIEMIIPLLPALGAGLGVAAKGAAWLADMFASILSHKAVADTILGVAAAVYVAIKAIALLQFAVRAYTAVQIALDAAMDANPIGLVVLAVEALIAAFVIAYNKSDTFRMIVDQVGRTLLLFGQIVIANVVFSFHAFWDILQAVGSGLHGLYLMLTGHLSAGWHSFGRALDHAKNIGHDFTQMQGKMSKAVRDFATKTEEAQRKVDHAQGKSKAATAGYATATINQHGRMAASYRRLSDAEIAAYQNSRLEAVRARRIALIQRDNMVVHTLSQHQLDTLNSMTDGQLRALLKQSQNASDTYRKHQEQVSTAVTNFLNQDKLTASARKAFVAGVNADIRADVDRTIGMIMAEQRALAALRAAPRPSGVLGSGGRVPGTGSGAVVTGIGGMPRHAKGTITSGPELAWIGDNVGGREAVIPLDKYDLPKKGDSQRDAVARREENEALRSSLREQTAILKAMLSKMGYDDLIDALGKMSEAQVRKMIQTVRASE